MILDNCFIAYINLSHRTDRREHMTVELSRVNINAQRWEAINTGHGYYKPAMFEEAKVRTMLQRTPGAIGCHYSQVAVMTEALACHQHAFVMEDDLTFCADFMDRMEYMERYFSTRYWDIIWLGGTFHVNPCIWHTGNHPQLRGSDLGRDAECTDDPRIMRTFGAFSTYAYIVNKRSLPKILHLLDQHVGSSMGIDWLFIKLQPQLLTYAFVPGCVKQIDNKSDIGNGMTFFSHFKSLGPYWWANYMDEFDPSTFNWSEADTANKKQYTKPNKHL